MKQDNYFTLFDLPVSISIESSLLKRTYFSLSRQYHPDFYTQSSAAEQEAAMQQSTLINEAYKVLGDEESCLKYVLSLHGIDLSGNAQALPQDFLMDMMDLNEEIEDATTPEQKTKLKSLITELSQQYRNEVLVLLESNDLSEVSDEQLNSLKNYYLKNRYIKRLQGAITE